METKELFTLIGLIPESQVQTYKVEYVRRPNAEHLELSKLGVANVSKLDTLFLQYFENSHFDILRCFVYFNKDSFIEIDTLSKSIYIKGNCIEFPFFDKLIEKGILGSKKSIQDIKWV